MLDAREYESKFDMKISAARLAWISLAFLLAWPASAADITVDADCSLADAITAANTDTAANGCPAGDGADTITLSGDVALEAALPHIISDITVEGAGFTINGNGKHRIFYIDGGTAAVNELTMTKGLADKIDIEGETYVAGGAVVNKRGRLTLARSDIRGSAADLGGAVYNEGLLTIADSVFRGNSAGYGGAVLSSGGEISIIDSVFHDNSADARGGAVYNDRFSALVIINSAIRGNSAGGEGGGLYADGAAALTHVTLADNAAAHGGGIYAADTVDLRLINSIIVDHAGGDCFGGLNESIGNFIEDGSCLAEYSGDPMLGEFVQPEDGSSAYYPLLEGSPAIDAADDDYCAETDQIGTARPQGAGCDIGAVEYAPGD